MGIILSLIFTRLFSAYLYFFTDWFYGVFDTKFRPIVGFIFMPLTMLRFSAVQNWHYGHRGFWQVVVMIIAILVDLGSLGGGAAEVE